jgi:hypothetical protein
MPETDEELLTRFQPHLLYDSLEAYFADSAEEWTANPLNRLCNAAGDVIATAGDGLSLDFLSDDPYPGGAVPEPTDYIESTKDDYQAQYQAIRKTPGFRNVTYGRVVRAHGVWLQYWFFYFLNDYQLAWGTGVHEGDWEMVMFRLAPEPGPDGRTQPEIAVYAQHTFCEVREWADVWRLAREKESRKEEVAPEDHDRPLVYVGRGSHASYFRPGYHETDFYDVTDGRRAPKVRPKLVVVSEPVPGWWRWPGRWGGHRAGEWGPDAPIRHDVWTHPDSLIAKQRHPQPHTPSPGQPRLAARSRKGKLLVEFDFSGMASSATRMVVNVNSENEPDVPPHVFRFALSSAERGSLDTKIPIEAGKNYDVSIAVVDADGRTTLPTVVFLPRAGSGLSVVSRLGAFAGRLVYWVRRLFGRR